MIIIIDGYNLLKQGYHIDRITEQERAQFIKILQKYALKKGHHIIIVFDGGDSEWPFQDKQGKVTIVYSGYRESADEFIIGYLEEKKSINGVVVSSDREIVAVAERYQVPSVEGEAFLLLLRQAAESPVRRITQDVMIKLSEEENEEVDALMYEEIEYGIPQKKVEITSAQRVAEKKISKKEKKLHALLKKL